MARFVFTTIAVLSASFVSADNLVDRADANADGYVSLYELRAAHFADPELNRRIEQTFADYDRDGDGRISGTERAMRAASYNNSNGADTMATNTNQANKKPGNGDQPRELTPVLPANAESISSKGIRKAQTKPNARSTSTGGAENRTASWIREIDADNSGGASIAELVASGDGMQWFREQDFDAADKNGDGDLNAAELANLIASLERRQR